MEPDSTIHTFSQFPESAVDDNEEAGEEGASSQLLEKKAHPVWSFDFYKELFDVDTHMVLNRIKGSVIPWPSSDFSRNYIGGKPDLYGPFWICATLVMTIAICGNLTTFFSHINDQSYHYAPQFSLLTVAVLIVYGYTFVIPILIRLVFFIAKVSTNSSYLDILCVYGYSTFIFIPLCFLLLIPNFTDSNLCLVHWILVALTVCLSGAVIMMSLWPSLHNENRKLGLVLLICVFALHFAFALSFKLYFFSCISLSSPSNVTAVTTSPGNVTSS